MANALLVEVPFCAFRPFTSREYQDTYPIPPPSAVYGMLLSLVGVDRDEKTIHRGAEMAIAVEQLPQKAKVFRKLRRGKTLGELRPDYQDLLLDLRLWVWLRRGGDSATECLAEKVVRAIECPATITRSGGLSLGESSYLVDTVRLEEPPAIEGVFLQADAAGFYSLPVWVDHADAQQTRSQRFSLVPRMLSEGPNGCWIEIP
jgi:CRISPR-associated protein Cas5t